MSPLLQWANLLGVILNACALAYTIRRHCREDDRRFGAMEAKINMRPESER